MLAWVPDRPPGCPGSLLLPSGLLMLFGRLPAWAGLAARGGKKPRADRVLLVIEEEQDIQAPAVLAVSPSWTVRFQAFTKV